MPDPYLPGFNILSDLISIFKPHQRTIKLNPSDPDLIILCSWVGAGLKHIAKYTSTHRRLYPHATILLIQSTVSSMMVEIDLDPVFEVLTSLQRKGEARKKVIVHAFSNGGARGASRLATEFVEAEGGCPFDTIIFDCCPGTADLKSTARAISISLPGWHAFRSLGFVAIYILAVVFMLIAKMLRWEDSISILRRNLNDPVIVPVDVPRLYLYSKADALVGFRDVGAHAADARWKGCRVVREEVFDGAMHCALVNVDGERYWDAVQEVVKIGGGSREG